MKRLLLVAVFLFSVRLLYAAPLVTESPIRTVGTPATIAVSSTTLTMVPTTQTAARLGIFIDNPSTNTENIVGFIGNCTSTALASTIRPIELSPSANTAYIPLREDVCLWLLSLDTAGSSDNVHIQEIMQ